MSGKEQETYTPAETERRRDEALRVALNTPHKPHSESKIGKARAKRAKNPAKRKSVSRKKNPSA